MTTIAAEAPRTSSSLARSALVAGAVLVAFTAYSLWVVAGYGYFGFLGLADREPWAMQLLLDLVIACSFGIGWMHGDAKRRGLTSWPFVPVVVALGSIGLLSYVVWRHFVRSADSTKKRS